MSAFERKVQFFKSAERFNGKCSFSGEALFIYQLGGAAQCVAAHFGLAAVGIEHAHTEVGLLGGTNQNHSVRTDAEMAAGKKARPGGGILHLLRKQLNVDVIVAERLHFREFHIGLVPFRPPLSVMPGWEAGNALRFSGRL